MINSKDSKKTENILDSATIELKQALVGMALTTEYGLSEQELMQKFKLTSKEISQIMIMLKANPDIILEQTEERGEIRYKITRINH